MHSFTLLTTHNSSAMVSYSPVSMFLSSSFFIITIVVHTSPTSLILKRSFPNGGMKLSQMKEIDMGRHGRMSQSHVLNLELHGSTQLGLYYTTVHLGSPPREFHVQFDTGSDVSWVNCVSCNGCPQTSNLGIKLNYFDPASSSTSSIISCSQHKCAICSTNNRCGFNIHYEDDSETSGYIVSDLMHFSNASKGVTSNSSMPLFFGCSNLRSGRLALDDRALDGILGFGKQETSLISQLYSQGKAPRVFSHCLKGDTSGGGILILGEVVEPNMSYTPLIPKQPHYNIYMESISVNGHILLIDPTVFTTSSNQGALVDSGTTMVHFTEGAYNPIVEAITHTLPQSVHTTTQSYGFDCYLVTPSVLSVFDIFPPISLNFANNASMVLTPQDYLLLSPDLYGGKWCLGFGKSQYATILGDIILKDKFVVYDMDNQRIGWTNYNYNCSLSPNVSTRSTGNDRNEKGGRPQKLTMTIIFAFAAYMTLMFV